MTFIECCQKAKAKGLQIIRPTRQGGDDYESRNFTAPPLEGQGWVYLDAWTASAVCAVTTLWMNAIKPGLKNCRPWPPSTCAGG